MSKWLYWNFMPISRFKKFDVFFYTNFKRGGDLSESNRLTFKNSTGIRFFGKYYVPVFFWRKSV